MINLFAPYENSDEIRVTAMKAFAEGLSVDNQVLDLFKGYRPCDTTVLFGVHKRSAKSGQENGKIINKHKGPYIVIELGFIHRERYFMIGFGGLNGRADFKNENSPSDRWEQLRIELKGKQEGTHIILCGQKKNDASVQNFRHEEWLKKTAQYLLDNSKSPVVFRPHPLETKKKAVNIKVKGLEYSDRTFEEDLNRAKTIITFNSNSAVESVVAGVPVFAFDKGSMVWPICNRDLKDINNPKFPDRTQWANNLAYTQWTLEEMKQGLPQRHLCLI